MWESQKIGKNHINDFQVEIDEIFFWKNAQFRGQHFKENVSERALPLFSPPSPFPREDAHQKLCLKGGGGIVSIQIFIPLVKLNFEHKL